MNPRLSTRVWQSPSMFLAFGFGSGLSPVAPGTCGTLVAIPLYLMMARLNTLPYLALTLLFFAIGVSVCDRASSMLNVHDHPGIVWDEVVGYLLTMAFAPVGAIWVIAGFILFRLFDIWKPFPIRSIDRHVHGGTGIMLDDVLAALYAAAVLWAATLAL
ncbi:phosphatidylglycerophosphatase A [Legionella geestiana]|uniref:Phosphatidylglycerophosphatase A n=1 Tax=Legionella geestiana TaxID=45065 RepID=A0A0W0TW96_9GAMM|nr:phosphatidylglycerophosphatase A [Legionella geestiana]KTC99701.1 phosphatidylglycerophosphatase A [Legionella geestiana]QBS13176.1 phosphatidylglycerophosphatase A [Legionella geestiana]QDQ39142.1 phosphatidylglycerophosphatase A [Legionella geestiana]STX54304.1 phosphatidylglycerophosphatase A [Legionella geestiana]